MNIDTRSTVYKKKSPFKDSFGARHGDVVVVVVGGVVTVLATVSDVAVVVVEVFIADARYNWTAFSGDSFGLPLYFGNFGVLTSISLLRISAATIDRKLYSSTIDLSKDLPSKSGTNSKRNQMTKSKHSTIARIEKITCFLHSIVQ